MPNITLNGNLAADGLTIVDGLFIASGYDVDIAESGIIIDCSGLDLGTGLWSSDGTFDFADVIDITGHGVYNVYMNGSGTNDSGVSFLNQSLPMSEFTVGSDGNVFATGEIHTDDNLILSGMLTLESGTDNSTSGNLYIYGDGGLDGSTGAVAEYRIMNPGSGEGLVTFDDGGEITEQVTLILNGFDSGAIFSAGSFGSLVFYTESAYGSNNIDMSGDYTCAGNVLYQTTDATELNIAICDDGTLSVGSGCDFSIHSGDITVNNPGHFMNYDFNVGDITITELATGSLNWTRGSGEIRFDTAGDQDFGLCVSSPIEQILVNKPSGTVTLSCAEIDTSNLFIANGNVNLSGNDLTIENNLTVQPGGNFIEAGFGGNTIAVGGDLSLNGTSTTSVVLGGAAGTTTVTVSGTGAINYGTITNVTSTLPITACGSTDVA